MFARPFGYLTVATVSLSTWACSSQGPKSQAAAIAPGALNKFSTSQIFAALETADSSVKAAAFEGVSNLSIAQFYNSLHAKMSNGEIAIDGYSFANSLQNLESSREALLSLGDRYDTVGDLLHSQGVDLASMSLPDIQSLVGSVGKPTSGLGLVNNAVGHPRNQAPSTASSTFGVFAGACAGLVGSMVKNASLAALDTAAGCLPGILNYAAENCSSWIGAARDQVAALPTTGVPAITTGSNGRPSISTSASRPVYRPGLGRGNTLGSASSTTTSTVRTGAIPPPTWGAPQQTCTIEEVTEDGYASDGSAASDSLKD